MGEHHHGPPPAPLQQPGAARGGDPRVAAQPDEDAAQEWDEAAQRGELVAEVALVEVFNFDKGETD